MSDSFATAAAALPDGGSAIASTIGAPTSASAGTATPGDARTAQPITESASAGTGSGDVDPALPSDPATADPNAVKPLDASVLAQARQQLEADPQYANIFALRNRFSDGDLKGTLPMIEALVKNPKQFVTEMIADLRAAGQWDEPAAPVAREPFKLPDADISSEDGSVKTYSQGAVGKIVEGILAQVDEKLAGLSKTVEPILSDRQAADIERAEKAAYDARLKEVTPQLARARTIIPDFKALEPKIHEAMAADFAKPAHMRTLNGDFYAAYDAVKQAHPQSSVDPTRQAVLDDLRTKAEAAPLRTTRATAGGDSRPVNSFAELAERNKGFAGNAASSIAR